MTDNQVAWIDLSPAANLAETLESARLDGARVVVLDATGSVAPDGNVPLLPIDLIRYELPTISVFEGALAGSAAELALAADIRVCGAQASLAGRLKHDARIRTLGGDAAAMALFFGREPVPAPELLDMGLISHLTPAGQATIEARRLAEVIASRGPIATRLAKEALWRGLGQPLEQALRFETDLTLLLQTTKDRAEGVRAFLEKRQPVFKGE